MDGFVSLFLCSDNQISRLQKTEYIIYQPQIIMLYNIKIIMKKFDSGEECPYSCIFSHLFVK